MNSEQRTLLKRALPFLYEAAEPYIDDGGNEPLELAREIERTLEQPASAAGVEGMAVKALAAAENCPPEVIERNRDSGASITYRAALDAIASAIARQGGITVPVEPTEAIILAMSANDSWPALTAREAACIYAAMLAAAPKPEDAA